MMIKVISLPCDIERRNSFSLNAKNAGVIWSYYDAHDSITDDLSYNAKLALIRKGRHLTDSELGCYASHFSVWKMFLNSDHGRLLVMEDDVVFDWDFIKSAFDDPSVASLSGIIRLFSRAPPKCRIIGETPLRYILEFNSYISGTQAYIIDRPAAKRLLDFCINVDRPIDDQLDRSWAHNISNYGIFPYPAFERIGRSRIGDQRAKFSKLPNSYIFKRAWSITVEYIMRERYKIRRKYNFL